MRGTAERQVVAIKELPLPPLATNPPLNNAPTRLPPLHHRQEAMADLVVEEEVLVTEEAPLLVIAVVVDALLVDNKEERAWLSHGDSLLFLI